MNEQSGRRSTALPDGYTVILPEHALLAPDAEFWFSQAIAETGADLLYSDEDVLDAAGRRRDPVFKPAWSPELWRGCDYLGGAYVVRDGVKPGQGTTVHVPHVLVHRRVPFEYQARTNGAAASKALVSVIICSRTPALAGACLAALRRTTAWAQYEIILIDHGGLMEALSREFGARRVVFEADFNFAAMCNAGVRAAAGDLVLFLNDDAMPLEAGWMGKLVAQAGRPAVGVAGALLTFPDGRIQHAGIYVGTPNGAGHPGRLTRGRATWPWLSMTREQSAVTGACLMMRRAVFEELGGFDEAFPFNYNDVDLCLKCRQAGYQVVVEAEARLEHRESATRKTGIRYAERRRFLERWGRLIERGDPFLNPNLSDDEDLLPDPEAFPRVGAWR